MRVNFWLMAAVIVLLAGLQPATAADVRVSEPRTFGYLLGDTLVRQVEIRLGEGETLVEGSLPRPGPVTYWLELVAVEPDTSASATTGSRVFRFTYQIFYSALDTRKLTVPVTTLSVRTGDATGTVTVPSLDISIAPLREVFPDKNAERDDALLKPDRPEPFARTGAIRTALLGGSALLIAALGLLAHHFAWWPFQARRARPFSRAMSEVKDALAMAGDGDGYRRAMVGLHRAFDEAHGARLLADDVGDFLARRPAHAESRAGIETFFAASRALFFGENARRAEDVLASAGLVALARDLARQERQSL